MHARHPVVYAPLLLCSLGCSTLFGLEDLTIGDGTTTGVGGSGVGGSGVDGGGGTGGTGGTSGSGGQAGGGAVGGAGGSVPVAWQHIWSTSFSGAGMDAAWDLSLGPSDAIALSGSFQQALTVGTDNHTSNSDDPFVAVGSANGGTWDSASLVTAGLQAASGIAMASDGSVIMAGAFANGLTLNGCTNLNASNAADIFVVKLDAQLQCDWAHAFGFGAYGVEYADYRIAFDPVGNVVVAGPFGGQISLPGISTLTTQGTFDVFVLRFNYSTGAALAGASFGNSGNASAKDLAVDTNGNVFLAGWFDDAISFETLRTTAGDADIFVAKLNSSLVPQWSVRAGDAEKQAATSVAVDGAGNVVVGGYHRGAIDLGGGSLSSPADRDAWLARYDTNGQHLFSESYGAAGDQVISALDADAAGRVVITGESKGAVDFGGGLLTSSTSTGIFLALFDETGAHLRSMLVGDQGTSQVGLGVAFAGNGETIVTGAFDGAVHFGGDSLASAGGWDVFVARMGP